MIVKQAWLLSYEENSDDRTHNRKMDNIWSLVVQCKAPHLKYERIRKFKDNDFLCISEFHFLQF